MRITALKVLKHFSALLSLWILFMSVAHASEPAFVRESLRARGMGNAFTAVANDEMLFFYIPAGLRSVIYNSPACLDIPTRVTLSCPKNLKRFPLKYFLHLKMQPNEP